MTHLIRLAALTALLAAAVTIPITIADERPKAMQVEVSRPASAANKLNRSLKAMYESLVATSPKPDEIKTLAEELNKNLDRLSQLDVWIERLGPGLGDPELKQTALRYRALVVLATSNARNSGQRYPEGEAPLRHRRLSHAWPETSPPRHRCP